MIGNAIGIFLLILVLFGYHKLFMHYGDFSSEISWVSAACLIILLLYVSAYFSLLEQMSFLIAVFGLSIALISFFGKIRARKFDIPKFTVILLGLTIMIGLFTFTIWQINLDHYDNYSHWALIVKFLFTEGRLPTINDPIITFTSYPMGSSLFVYFTTYLAGFSDRTMMMGQFILIILCLNATFAVIRDKSRGLIIAMFLLFFAVFNYYNIAIRVNNLLVDYLIAVITLAAFSGVYKTRNQLYTMSVFTFLIVSVLTLVKSSAAFFAALVLIYYSYQAIRLWRYFKNKYKLIATWLATSVLSFVPLLVWNLHVKTNFPVSLHEVDLASYQENLMAKDEGVIQTINEAFVQTVFNLSTISTQGLLLIQLLMVGGYLIIRFICKRKNPLLKYLLLINTITVVYYTGIYFMFLFSMPTLEAVVLAGFERYASTMVILGLGMAMLFLSREIDYSFYEQNLALRNYRTFKSINTKHLYQTSTLAMLFAALLMTLSETNGMLYNHRVYYDSIPGIIQRVVDDEMELNDLHYLIVSTNAVDVNNYFAGYVGKYWLYSPNVDAYEDFVIDQDDFEDLLSRYDRLIILEDHHTFNEMTELVFGETFSPGGYRINKISSNE